MCSPFLQGRTAWILSVSLASSPGVGRGAAQTLGRYVRQSHPTRLNSIKESTKTYGSEACDMIREPALIHALPYLVVTDGTGP